MDIRILNWLQAQREAERTNSWANHLFEEAQAAEIPPDDRLRPATPDDIKLGNIIWYKDGDDGPFWMDVDEVISPNDPWKAFYSTEGSSYGLDGAFVEVEYIARASEPPHPYWPKFNPCILEPYGNTIHICKPSLPPLSPEAQEARKPPPPEELVGALQDRVHIDVGRARPGRAVKIKRAR